MDFSKRLEQAIQRGEESSKSAEEAKAAQSLTIEELKNRHATAQLELSEHIERCMLSLVDQIPGFRLGTIADDRGWGAAVSRDDFAPRNSGQRSYYSRLEVHVRPFTEHAVLNLVGKGTVRNKEVFKRNFFEDILKADVDQFKQMIDLWVLDFAEKYASDGR